MLLLELQDIEWVHERLSELVVLLPDIVAKLNNVKADLLLQLLDTKVGDQTGAPSRNRPAVAIACEHSINCMDVRMKE